MRVLTAHARLTRSCVAHAELFESAVVSFEDALLALGCAKSTVLAQAPATVGDSKHAPAATEEEEKGGGRGVDDNGSASASGEGASAGSAGVVGPKVTAAPVPRTRKKRRRGSVVALSHVQRQAEVDCRTSLANSLYRLGLLEPHGAHSAHTQALFQRCECRVWGLLGTWLARALTHLGLLHHATWAERTPSTI